MNLIARLLVACLLGLQLSSAHALDVQALTQDLKQQEITPTRLRLALWLPTEFFAAVNPNPSPQVLEQLKRMLGGYVVFMVLDAQISPLGTPTPMPRTELLSSTTLTLANGKSLAPMADSDLKGDLKTLREILKPVMKNIAGPVGEAMDLVAFKLPAGNPDVSPANEGKLKLVVADHDYAWRLPLGSVLPAMYDPDSGERFPGNYLFNPYTGHKLETK